MTVVNNLKWDAQYADAIEALKKINSWLDKQRIAAKDTAVSIRTLNDGSQQLVGTFTSLEGGIRQVNAQLVKSGNSFKAVNVSVKDLTGNMNRLSEKSQLKLTGLIEELTKVESSANTSAASWSSYHQALLKVEKYIKSTSVDLKTLKSVISSVGQGTGLKQRTEETAEFYDLVSRAVEATKRLNAESGKKSVISTGLKPEERAEIDKTVESLKTVKTQLAISGDEWARYHIAVAEVTEFLDKTNLKFEDLDTALKSITTGEQFAPATRSAAEFFAVINNLVKATGRLGEAEAKRLAKQTAKRPVEQPTRLSPVQQKEIMGIVDSISAVTTNLEISRDEWTRYQLAVDKVRSYIKNTDTSFEELNSVVLAVNNNLNFSASTTSAANFLAMLNRLVTATQKLGEAKAKELASQTKVSPIVPGLSTEERSGINALITSISGAKDATKASIDEINRYQAAWGELNTFLNKTKISHDELIDVIDKVSKVQMLEKPTASTIKFFNIVKKTIDAAKNLGSEFRSLESGASTSTAKSAAALEKQKAVIDLLSVTFDPTGKSKWGDKDFFGDAPAENITRLVSAGNRLIKMASKANVTIAQLTDSVKKGFNLEITESGTEASRLNVEASKLVPVFGRVAASSGMAAERFQRLNNTIRKTANDFTRADAQADKFFKAINNFKRLVWARVITMVFYKLSESFSQSLKVADDLVLKMGEIQTILPAVEQTTGAFFRLSDAVRRTSDAFNLPQLDVAEGFYQTLSNQISNSIIETEFFIGSAAKLAKTTASTLPEAIDALSSALNSYNYTVAESTRLSEELFDMVDVGRLRLSDVANTIGNVTTVASDLGVSFDEVTESLGVMTIRGMQPRVAMTLLRNIMLKLQDPTEKMTEVFHALGVETGAELLATYSLSDAIDKIIGVTGRGTKALIEAAGTSRAYRAAIALLVDEHDRFNDSLTTGEEKVDNYSRALEVRMGNAAENVNKQLNIFKNFFVSDVSQKIILLADKYNKAFNEMFNTTNSLSTTLRGVTKFIAVFIGAVAAFGSIKGAAIALTWLSDKIKDVWKNIKILLTVSKGRWFDGAGASAMSFSSALGLVVAGITTAIMAYKFLFKDVSERFQKFSDDLNEKVGQKLSKTLKRMGDSATAERIRITEETRKMMDQIAEPYKEVSDKLAVIKFDETVYGTAIDKLKDQLKIENDILEARKKQREELKQQIDQLDTAIDRSYELLRSTGQREEDYRFERQTRDLGDIDKAWARINRTPVMKQEFLQLYEQLKNDPEAYLKYYEMLQESYDRYSNNLIQGEADLYSAMTSAGKTMDFSQFNQALDSMFNLGREIVNLKLQFEEDAREKLVEQYNQENSLIQQQRDLVNLLEDDIAAIEQHHKMIQAIQELEISKTVEKNKLIAEQLTSVEKIYNKYIGMNDVLDKLIKNDSERVLLEEKLKNLKDTKESIVSTSEKAEGATGSYWQAQNDLAILVASMETSLGNMDFALKEVSSELYKESKKIIPVGPYAGPSVEFQKEWDQRERKFLDASKVASDVNAKIIESINNLREIFDKETSEYTPEDAGKIQSIIDTLSKYNETLDRISTISESEIDPKVESTYLKSLSEWFKSIEGSTDTIYSIKNSKEMMDQANIDFSRQVETTSTTVGAVTSNLGNLGTAAGNLADYFNNLSQSTGETAGGYAKGGFINWRKIGTDTIPAMLTPGEFVVKASVAKQNRDFLQMLNAGYLSTNNFKNKAAYARKSMPTYMSQGGPVSISNNNNITLQSTGNNSFDAIIIGKALNREQRKGTLSLTGKKRLF